MTIRSVLALAAAGLFLAAVPAPASAEERCVHLFGACVPPRELPCLTLDVPPQFVPCP